MGTGKISESDSGQAFLTFEDGLSFEQEKEQAMADFLLGNGAWFFNGERAVFYPACEHPNVIRGYN